jgi:hypothetical protein
MIAAAAPTEPARAYNLFGPYPWGTEGEIYYSKWGDFHHAGAHGGTITWSIMPDGTTIDPSFTDANYSGTSSMVSIMNGLGYSQSLAAIERAFDRWSVAANIYFEQVPDSGSPFNSAAAAPPDTGTIRLGAFPIANFGGGAVGFAPHPNGFTSLEGDILLNANSTFFFDDGAEGDLIDVFNDFESLIQHETGHAVGLDHSDTQSVMSVNFEIYKHVNRELDADDVAAVQFLYGPALAADFDHDNDVDGQDLAEWKSGYGTADGGGQVEGDADRDGDVDGGDFLAWQRELGGAAAPAAASVPEPAALQLAWASALLMAAFRSATAPTKLGRGYSSPLKSAPRTRRTWGI